MKNLIQLKKSRVVRPMWLAASAAVVVAAAAGIAAENGVLTVTGTNASDNIALRLQAGRPGTLQVDLGDDGSADFSFARAAVAKIALDGGNSGDRLRIDESNGVFGDTIPTTINGGNGNDELFGGTGAETLLGGNGNDLLVGGGAGTLSGGNGDDTVAGGPGAETLLGGNGNDSIDGNKGNDVAFMGNGGDTFVWDPGDGSDTIEGQNGEDTMVFNGEGRSVRERRPSEVLPRRRQRHDGHARCRTGRLQRPGRGRPSHGQRPDRNRRQRGQRRPCRHPGRERR